MLDFLNSSKRIAQEVAVLILQANRAKAEVKSNRINEAIKKLKEISSEESKLYKKIKRNQEGLAQEVLEQEVGKTLRIAQKIIELLQQNKIDEALEWLTILINREIDIQKWVQHRIAVREHAKKSAKNIKPILKKYIRKGMAVIELFNGEHSDILTALSELVGKNGHVYGLDELNPFEMFEHMVTVNALPNVDLIKATFPEMPTPAVDVIVVREFHYVNQAGDRKTVYAALNSKLKKGGFLVLFLNHTEYNSELAYQSYSKSITQFLSNYKKIEFNELELVFQKK